MALRGMMKCLDVRRTHCILCSMAITNMDWLTHLTSCRHVALNALGAHFNTFLTAKSRHNFESGLLETLGITSASLADERTAPNEFRRNQLGSLMKWILSPDTYPQDAKDREMCKVIGRAVVHREATLLLCRLYPTWAAHQLQALATLISTPEHISTVSSLLGLDRDNSIDLLSTLGHFQRAETLRKGQVVLTTLTRHCIDATVFELYNTFVWEKMPSVSAVWDLYIATRMVPLSLVDYDPKRRLVPLLGGITLQPTAFTPPPPALTGGRPETVLEGSMGFVAVRSEKSSTVARRIVTRMKPMSFIDKERERQKGLRVQPLCSSSKKPPRVRKDKEGAKPTVAVLKSLMQQCRLEVCLPEAKI